LELTPDGLPVVAYAIFSLKLLRCGDPDCLANNAVTTLDGNASISEVSLELDSAGRPVIAYLDAFNRLVRTIRCNDASCSTFDQSSAPASVGSASISLKLTRDDIPIVAYTAEGELRILSCGDPSCSSKNTVASPLPLGEDCCSVLDPKLEIDSLGRPVVAYIELDDTHPFDRRLVVLRCGTSMCSSGNTISRPGVSVGSLAMTMDEHDAPVIVLATSRLEVLHCGDATCAEDNSIEEIEEAALSGADIAVSLDAEGRPVASYHGAGDLKVFHCGDSDCSADNIIRTADHGTYSGDVGLSTSIALDGAGRPVVAYWDQINDELKLARCGDPACERDNSVLVLQSDVAASFISLALDQADRPVVAFYEGIEADLALVRCDEPRCTSVHMARIDTAGDTGAFASLVLDGTGRPVISYFGYSTGSFGLRVVHCGDLTCASGNTIVAPDDQGFAGSHTSIALDDEGNPVVAYADKGYRRLRLLHCGDETCSTGNSISTLGPPGSGVIDTSLALDTRGNPVISYGGRLGQANVLRVLRCGDTVCSAGNTFVTLDVADSFEAHTSLELDGSGRPVVSYFGGDTIRVLRCSDEDCRGSVSIASIDSDSRGRFGSLALDSEGLPVVSYYEEPRGNLRVARCGDTSCGGESLPPTSGIGDVDCNDGTNAIDAAIVLQISAHLLSSASCIARSDVNSDGLLNAVDATLILQFSARLLSTLPT
jgi:hypothetical protein